MSLYYRHLPHWHPQSAWLFVTWRLAGTLPSSPALLLPQQKVDGRAGAAFVAFDRQMDSATDAPNWLADPRIAQIVACTLLAGTRERDFYQLRAWVIMHNHVHVLWERCTAMPRITRWVKGSTARKANLVLGRVGKVSWQDESYDHWVRNELELEKIVRYIESNPVQAGLVDKPEDWQWSSARRSGETA